MVNFRVRTSLLGSTLSSLIIISGGSGLLPVSSFPSWISLEFPPTQGENPQSTVGGSTRGQCLEKDKVLTFLGPGTPQLTTTSPSPSFFFYIPLKPDLNQAIHTQFELTQNQQKVFISEIEIDQAGILQIKLPPTTSLDLNQPYKWAFTIICDPLDQGANKSVEGGIKRTTLAPELATQLETTTSPLEQAELYAQAKLWHETLEIAASLRQENQQPWQQLLQSVGLAPLADIPFLSETPTELLMPPEIP